VTLEHPMTKGHYISFLAYVTSDRCQIVKLYPEGEAQARLPVRRFGLLYAYCNHHGLFRKKLG
ncbi:MAG: GNAT family N-acetyltransferase, partial [Clostridia bacterium]|nr:GNAT family N-acetyltransferase [Clostridia bacterium]